MKSLSSLIKEWFESLRNKMRLSTGASISMRNRYPCLLIGEKHLHDKNKTVIQYIIKSKRDTVYEISIEELLNDPMLIEKFHPTQAVKIGCIAMDDILYSTPEDQRKQKYRSIMYQMLKTERK